MAESGVKVDEVIIIVCLVPYHLQIIFQDIFPPVPGRSTTERSKNYSVCLNYYYLCFFSSALSDVEKDKEKAKEPRLHRNMAGKAGAWQDTVARGLYIRQRYDNTYLIISSLQPSF